MYLNLNLIEEELSREDGDSPSELVWLEESYRKPLAFWQALKHTQDSFSPIIGKSEPLKQYDFYNDIIIRYQRIPTPAFRWYDSVLGWQEISYTELGEIAGRQAAVWIRKGVQSGQILCIIYPFGVKYVVSLLAALKIGLIVSFLLPQGNSFLQRRLEVLNPDHIITEEIFFPHLHKWQDRLLPESGSAQEITVPERSYTYPTGSVVALCFDPSSQTTHIPKKLTSDAAYLCPLRDGMIALDLRPGRIVAAPGFHFFETHPGLLLASLLNGGIYLHLEPEDIAKNPELLIAYPIRAMGICNQVRDILLQNPVEAENHWHCWFRNPAESCDLDQWQAFIQTIKLQGVWMGNLKCDAALGGCSLFSIKRKGKAHLNVLPSAGIQWSLTDLSDKDLEVLGDYGVFSSALPGTKAKRSGTNILAKNQKEWLFVGSLLSGRSGRNYPRTEILETIRSIPFCSSCSIVGIPVSGTVRDLLFILLVFTGRKAGMDEAELTKKIRKSIEREMGQEFLPDRIQFFPLFPRRDADENIDHDWCQAQYLSGSLFRKSRQEIYRCITRLRAFVQKAG